MQQDKTIGIPIASLTVGSGSNARCVGYVVRWNTGAREHIWFERLRWHQKRRAVEGPIPLAMATRFARLTPGPVRRAERASLVLKDEGSSI